MRVIDSHTEGEPTRVIVSGGPDLGAGSVAARTAHFATRSRESHAGQRRWLPHCLSRPRNRTVPRA